MAEALKTPGAVPYDNDFYAWTQDQGAKLRTRAAFDHRGDIDWENVADEIESLGCSDKREIRSLLKGLLIHLLKWQFQPEKRQAGWRSAIDEQRTRLRLVLADSRSLQSFPHEALPDAYRLAVRKAAEETEIAEATFPKTCFYSLDDILDDGFFPESE